MVLQSVKAFLRKTLFVVVKNFPLGIVQKLLNYYGRIPSKKSYFSWMVSRTVNLINRQQVIEGSANSKKLSTSNEICHLECREELFQYIFVTYLQEPIDYLEFGVYKGASMVWWGGKLKQESNLFGFDTFEGLPEEWNYLTPKGSFDCNGTIPSINLPNVKFFKGRFDETLPFMLRETLLKPRLLLHLDADLYESTIYVLKTMRECLSWGTIILFDEYWDVKHEFRALQEFAAGSGKTFEYIAWTNSQAAIRITN